MTDREEITREDIGRLLYEDNGSNFLSVCTKDEFRAICNLALSAIPRKFDKETPDKTDDYVIWLRGHPVDDKAKHILFKDVATWDSMEDTWLLALPNNGEKDVTDRVVKWMPIPKGESNA